MTASALILADLLLSRSALSCLTARRADLANGRSNLPNLAVSNLAAAIPFPPVTTPSPRSDTPRQTSRTACFTASFCSLTLLQYACRAMECTRSSAHECAVTHGCLGAGVHSGQTA